MSCGGIRHQVMEKAFTKYHEKMKETCQDMALISVRCPHRDTSSRFLSEHDGSKEYGLMIA